MQNFVYYYYSQVPHFSSLHSFYGARRVHLPLPNFRFYVKSHYSLLGWLVHRLLLLAPRKVTRCRGNAATKKKSFITACDYFSKSRDIFPELKKETRGERCIMKPWLYFYTAKDDRHSIIVAEIMNYYDDSNLLLYMCMVLFVVFVW